MLMVVNPFDCMFTHQDMIVSNTVLWENLDYHILDTESLVVKTYSYNELYRFICAGNKIWNVSRDGKYLRMRIGDWCFCGYRFDIASQSGGISCPVERKSILVNGKNLVFNMTTEWIGTTFWYIFWVNDIKLCTWSDLYSEVFNFDILYIYKIQSHLIVRVIIEIELGPGLADMVSIFTVFVNERGEVEGFYADNADSEYKEGAYNPSLIAKFLTVYKYKY